MNIDKKFFVMVLAGLMFYGCLQPISTSKDYPLHVKYLNSANVDIFLAAIANDVQKFKQLIVQYQIFLFVPPYQIVCQESIREWENLVPKESFEKITNLEKCDFLTALANNKDEHKPCGCCMCYRPLHIAAYLGHVDILLAFLEVFKDNEWLLLRLLWHYRDCNNHNVVNIVFSRCGFDAWRFFDKTAEIFNKRAASIRETALDKIAQERGEEALLQCLVDGYPLSSNRE